MDASSLYAQLLLDFSSFEIGVKKAKQITDGLEKDIDDALHRIKGHFSKAGGAVNTELKNPIEKGSKETTQAFLELGNSIKTTTDGILAKLTEIGEAFQKVPEKASSAADKTKAAMKSVGIGLSAMITAPTVLFGKAALDTFTNFEQSMQNTFSVMGASGAEIEALKKKAEEMGASTRFSASQAADALYNLGSAGQNASQAMNSLDGVLKLAGATGSDLAFTSSTISSTLSQFNLTADKSAHIADVFSMAISKSQANMTKLSYSMKYVGPVAAGLNVSLETSTAALMKLYNSGFGGEQAGTILRAGLQKLASGTDDLKSKLEALGLSYDDVNPKTNNLADILERLKNANVDVTKSSELFGEVAAAGMQKLIEGGGAAIRTMDGLLQASDGAAAKMQEIQNTSFANTKAEMASAFEAVQITLTSNVIPAVDTVAKGITNVLKWVNELPKGVQVTGTAFAGLAASAGPLLLVAVGIAKIKAEMVQLNVALLHNPITLWAAGIAAAGAIAFGIITQIKHAHEEAEKAAGRYYGRAEKLAKEAEDAKVKNNKITSLMNTYDELNRKVNKTTEEQEAYNNTLKELQTLVPDLIIEQDKLGNAYIANAEKAKEAQQELLKIEKEKTEHALLVSNLSAKGAEKNLEKYKKQREELEQQAKIAQEEQKRAEENVAAVQRIVDEYNNKTKDKETAGKEIFQKTGYVSGVRSLRAIEKEAQKASKQTEALAKNLSQVNEKISEQEKILAENKLLTEKLANLKNLINKEEEQPAKKSRKQYADEKWADYENQKKRIAEEKKDAELLQQEYDDISKRMEAVRNKITELKSLSAEQIADGQFTSSSKELQAFYDELERLAKLAEQKKGSGSTKSEEDNSYQAQIDNLDKFYKEKLTKAREYGQNSIAIEKEYEEKRFKLIETFIEKEAALKNGRENALKVETKKGSGITFEDELNKTNLINNAFAKFLQQQKELQTELDKTETQIEEVKALIESDDYSKTEGSEEQARAYLKELQEEANRLEIELFKSKYSLSQIDDTLKNLDRNGKSNFQLQLIDIEEEKKRLYQIIAEAKKNKQGKFKDAKTQEEADAIEKNYQNVVNKMATASKASVAASIVNGVMGVAGTITNVVANAIEQGGIDGFAATKAVSDVIGQIGNAIPEPISKAVLGGISAVMNMTTTILQAADAARAKVFDEKIKEIVDSSKETTDEAAEKIVRDIHKSIEEQAQSPMKEAATSLLQAITNGFQNGDFTDFSKSIDNVVKKLIVDKMIMFSGLSEAIQGLVNGMFNGFKGSGEQQVEAVKKSQEPFKQEMDATRKEYEAYKKLVELRDEGLRQQKLYRHKRTGHYAGMWESTVKKEVTKLNGEIAKLEGSAKRYEAAYKELEKLNEKIKEINPNERVDLTNIKAMDKEELNRLVKEYGDPIKEVFKTMGFETGEGFQTALVESMKDALSTAMGEAAYNADWGSFKKSFASEMKKAIIQIAVENAGLKKKVNTIIAGIMEDGKITGDEITNTIDKLKDFYDGLESNMAELAKITKALEGGVEVKAKSSGSIIQQLSGADRDWFTEIFKEGFSKINQVIDLKETTIQHLAATQLIINSLNFTSYNGSVYITATENTNLKDLIGELVKEALAG